MKVLKFALIACLALSFSTAFAARTSGGPEEVTCSKSGKAGRREATNTRKVDQQVDFALNSAPADIPKVRGKVRR